MTAHLQDIRTAKGIGRPVPIHHLIILFDIVEGLTEGEYNKDRKRRRRLST